MGLEVDVHAQLATRLYNPGELSRHTRDVVEMFERRIADDDIDLCLAQPARELKVRDDFVADVPCHTAEGRMHGRRQITHQAITVNTNITPRTGLQQQDTNT